MPNKLESTDLNLDLEIQWQSELWPISDTRLSSTFFKNARNYCSLLHVGLCETLIFIRHWEMDVAKWL